MPTLEERYEKKAREAEELRRQLAKKRARERGLEEKWRTATLIQVGAILLKSASLDWKNVDLARLEGRLSESKAMEDFHLAVRADADMSASQAHEHLLAYKRESRVRNRNRRRLDEAATWLSGDACDSFEADSSING